ncbi:hypothetical protein R6Q59_033553, partial [Mikania micrantha]
NGYYNTQRQQSNDLHLKMPPQPQSGLVSSEQQWVAPPPPQLFTSSFRSSSSYSGPYQAPLPPPHPGITLTNTNTFTYDDLATATKGFDQSLLCLVMFIKEYFLVWSRRAEFQAEVEIISRVHHRHLVSLVGYCIAEQQLILVYEFVPNKTLEYHIHGDGCPVLDCSTSLQIALGAAKGFAYLHEDCNPRIIHRDIKAANILLNEHYEAKVYRTIIYYGSVWNNPTNHPTHDQNHDPIYDQNHDLTLNLTHGPNHDLNHDVNHDSNHDSTHNPIHDSNNYPTLDSNNDPTHGPNHDPTHDPNHDPIYQPNHDPIHEIPHGPNHDSTHDT